MAIASLVWQYREDSVDISEPQVYQFG